MWTEHVHLLTASHNFLFCLAKSTWCSSTFLSSAVSSHPFGEIHPGPLISHFRHVSCSPGCLLPASFLFRTQIEGHPLTHQSLNSPVLDIYHSYPIPLIHFFSSHVYLVGFFPRICSIAAAPTS